MNVSKIDLGLTGYNELFMNDQSRAESRLPRIHEIPISQIDDFPEHPFLVKLDEDMEQLVDSIRKNGVMTPATVRLKENGRYELVSGHRRKKACELAELETLKCEVRDLNHDEAVIVMVESNMQRSVILPSEKAFAYKMRLEAMNRRGQRIDLTCSPLGNKLQRKKSSDELAEKVGESKNQIFRYIRLTELVRPLLDMVDAGRLGFRPAVELSYLQKSEQTALLEIMVRTDTVPTLAQASKLKSFSQEKKLNMAVMDSILAEEKPSQRQKISFRAACLRKYIPANVPADKTEDYVLKALEFYQRFQEQNHS